MRTCGIDPATCTGMAVVGDGEDRGTTVHLPDERGFDRLHLIANNVARILDIWSPDLVAVESYAYVRNVRAFATLVEVGTVIRTVLYDQRRPWVEVPPTVLKKWTSGKGNATKAQMAVAVHERWGFRSGSTDIADAYALAQMAQGGWSELMAVTGVAVGWANLITVLDPALNPPRSGKE